MKTLFVPTDFSANAKNATNYALDLAKTLKSKITLFNSYELPYAETEIIVNVVDVVKKASEGAMEEELQQISSSKNSIEVNGYSKFGTTVSAICNEAVESKADMIVMGTHGATGIAKLLLGSNAAGVAKQAKLPVLVIPEKQTFAPFKKIVFAYDMQKADDVSVLKPLFDLAKHFNAHITILNINNESGSISTRSAVSGVKLHNELAGIDHHFVFSENPNIAEGIKEAAHKYNGDLLVMVSRHHSLFELLFHKSATKHVAYGIDMPLLVLHD